ncbi:MAG: hypothetical protein VCD31_18560, partial [Alphaproteobacteria bacterium]
GRPLESYLGHFVGPQEIGRNQVFWLAVLAVIGAGTAAPEFFSRYELLNFSYILTGAFWRSAFA